MKFVLVLFAALVIWFSVFTLPAGSDVAVATKASVKKKKLHRGHKLFHRHKKRLSAWQLRKKRRTEQRRKVVRAAASLLGVPYVFGGTGRRGVDCSGLTRYAYKRIHKHLPHLAAAQERLGQYVRTRNLKPGDLLFYYGGGHVAMYVGGGRMIEAAHTGTSVHTVQVRSGYDQARRLI